MTMRRDTTSTVFATATACTGGHRAALHRRGAGPRRSGGVRRPQLGRCRPAALGSGCAAPEREEGHDLPCDELREHPVRRESPGDRQQRRPQRRPPGPQGVPVGGWGDIIPPYTYIDENGELETLPGQNWTEDGQAIYKHGCDRPRRRAEDHPVPPVRRDTGDGSSPTSGTTTRTQLRSTPGATQHLHTRAGRPRPAGHLRERAATGRGPGRSDRDGAVTWHLTGNRSMPGPAVDACLGSITVVKDCPHEDRGRFDLRSTGGRGRRGGRRRRRHDGHDRGRGGPPSGERGRRAGTKQDDYTVGSSAGTGQRRAGGARRSGDVAEARRSSARSRTRRTRTAGHGHPVARVRRSSSDGGADVAFWGYATHERPRGHDPERRMPRRTSSCPGLQTAASRTCSSSGRLPAVFHTPLDSAGDADVDSGRSERVGGRGLPAVHRDARGPQGRPARATRALRARDQRPARRHRRERDDNGPDRSGRARAPSSEVAGPGTSLADYDSRVDCTRNGAAAASAHRDEGRRRRRPRRRRRLHLHEPAQGHAAAEPPDPPSPLSPPKPPNRRRPPPRRPAAAARPRGREDGDADDRQGRRPDHWTMTVTNRSTVEAADVNGVKVDDPRSFRTKRISLRLSGHLPPVHVRPRASRARRVRNGRRRDRGDAGRTRRRHRPGRLGGAGVELRNNVAAALRRSSGPGRRCRTRCSTLTAAPRALQSGRSSVVRLTARNPLGRPVAGFRVLRARPGCRPARADRPAGVARLTVSPGQLGLVHFIGSPGGSSEEARPAERCSASSARPHAGHRLASPRCRSASRAAPAA